MRMDMSRIIMETGRYATEPFWIERLYVNIYSVEELCYLLTIHGDLLDQEIMKKELIRWLETQCGLDQLAHTLCAMQNQGTTAAAFAGAILSYVKLYPQKVIEQTEALIRANEGLSQWERKKRKADYLLKNRRYYGAMKQYHLLLAELPEQERYLEAAIYHNMGCACGRLFLYTQAQQWFWKAYELDGAEESLLQYLAAIRQKSTDSEYVSFIAEHPEFHDASLKVEKQMEQCFGQFEGTDENRMLFTLQICKEEGKGNGNNVAYYDEIEKLTGRLKEQYLEFTL